MMTKFLATGAALAGLAFAGAAFAEPLEQDNIPASSPTSPNTVNPLPQRSDEASVTQDSTVRSWITYSEPQARTPVSSDVAVLLGIPIEVVASAPVPDTWANRALYGGPMSRAGKMTRPAGN